MNVVQNPQKPEITVAAGVLVRQDGYFMLARKKNGLPNGGQWEFPGGKVESGETPSTALARELKEELGLDNAFPCIPLLQYLWEDSATTIHFHFFIVRTPAFNAHSRDHDRFAWIRPGELVELDVVEADKKALSYLLDHPEFI